MLRRKKKFFNKKLLFYCCGLALPILQYCIFYIYVNFNSFILAFTNYDFYTQETTFAGFSKFQEVFYTFFESQQSAQLMLSLKNSLITYALNLIIGTGGAVIFSYYIYKKWAIGKTFKFFLFLPSVLPSILLVSVFKFFANEAIPGYMSELFNKTVTPLFIGKDTLMPTLLFYNVWASFGAQILIYTGAMDQISPDVMEAGKVDGVSPVAEFFLIVIPIILPTISTFLVANIAMLFSNQANLYAFFGDSRRVDYGNFTIGYYLFDLVNKAGNGKTMYTYASALGIICTMIAFPLTLGVRKLLNRGDE